MKQKKLPKLWERVVEFLLGPFWLARTKPVNTGFGFPVPKETWRGTSLLPGQIEPPAGSRDLPPSQIEPPAASRDLPSTNATGAVTGGFQGDPRPISRKWQLRKLAILTGDIYETGNLRSPGYEYMRRPITRREFNTRAGLGTLGLMVGVGALAGSTSGCSSTPHTRDEKRESNPRQSLPKEADADIIARINELKWQPTSADTVEVLMKYIDGTYSDTIIFAAGEALALQKDPRVLLKLPMVFMTIFQNTHSGTASSEGNDAMHRRVEAKVRLGKMLVMHFAAYPPARAEAMKAMLERADPYTARLSRYNAWGSWQMLSGLNFIGNEALRILVVYLQMLRSANSDGSEIDLRRLTEPLVAEYFSAFPRTRAHGSAMYGDWMARRVSKKRYPRTNDELVTLKDFERAQGSLLDSRASNSVLIKSIHVLLERFAFTREQNYRERLMQLLKEDGRNDELKRTIIAAFGAEAQLHPDVQRELIAVVASGNRDLVAAAAKALRWKEKVPLEPLLDAWQRTDAEETKLALESAIATIRDPRVFPVLVKALCGCKEEANAYVTTLMRRADNLKLWYILLGDERDGVLAGLIPSSDQPDMVIAWLRNTSTFAFYSEPTRIAQGWFSTISSGEDTGDRILPKALRNVLNKVAGYPLDASGPHM